MRDILATALHAFGVTRPSNPRRLTVVTFHRVLPTSELSEYPLPAIAITPEELGWFLDLFSESFTCGPLDRLHSAWTSGTAFERPPLAVTFDDAQADNFRHARPVLDQKRVRATFFAPTEAVERGRLIWHDRAAYAIAALLRDDPTRIPAVLHTLGLDFTVRNDRLLGDIVEGLKMREAEEREGLIQSLESCLSRPHVPSWDAMMSFDELGRLAAEEHEIGSHSHTHPILTRTSDAALWQELDLSRKMLAERLGRPPTSFCYPNGDADARVARAAQAAGYERATTTRWGWNPRGADPFQLRRFDIQSSTSRSRRGRLSAARVALRVSGMQVGLGRVGAVSR